MVLIFSNLAVRNESNDENKSFKISMICPGEDLLGKIGKTDEVREQNSGFGKAMAIPTSPLRIRSNDTRWQNI